MRERQRGIGGEGAQHVSGGLIMQVVETAPQGLPVQGDHAQALPSSPVIQTTSMMTEGGLEVGWVERQDEVAQGVESRRAAEAGPEDLVQALTVQADERDDALIRGRARQDGQDRGACRKVFGVYPALSLRAAYAPPNRRWPIILSAIAEKLKRRSKADFKGRHFEATLILQAVSWYLRYPLSYRDIEELLLERGLEVDHSTLNRWVLAYAPLIEKRLRAFRKPHCGSIRVDETYIKVRGQWRYLYRAIDKHGTSVDFLLTAK